MTVARQLIWLLETSVTVGLLLHACYHAYTIRLYAVKDYGRVIHEFDPWFNYRATEYLAANGWEAFFTWFDHRAWYPLGRPVGTTIYPGMQIAAVWLWKGINLVNEIAQDVVFTRNSERFGLTKKMKKQYDFGMSLNDVCVFMPAWFAVVATLLTAWLTYISTESKLSAATAANIMAIIPAHIMRSVAGGFDNESVAISCMVLTFACWCKAIKASESSNIQSASFWGVATGIAYICMVAAWGGFIFVLNLIATHCLVLCIPPFSRYNSSLHRAYTLFYIIGTLGATRVPVVGWGPLKSLEQLSGLVVFGGIQVLELVEIQRKKDNLSFKMVWWLRVKYFAIVFALAAAASAYLFSLGYFSPFTSRVRALFVKHTRTGNPLVDSVAEHQPSSVEAYKQYLHVDIYNTAQIGFVIASAAALLTYGGYVDLYYNLVGEKVSTPRNRWYISNSMSFLAYYFVIAFFFANKMSRLILLLGPISSILAGIAIGSALDFLITYPVKYLFFGSPYESLVSISNDEQPESEESTERENGGDESKSKGSKKKSKKKKMDIDSAGSKSMIVDLKKQIVEFLFVNKPSLIARISVGVYLVSSLLLPQYKGFFEYSDQMALRMSHPSIMFKAQLTTGKEIIVDDYREAYWWLRDNTPDDARVLSWWDYGYQISGIANRTTLADGNTWNHEHIATLGRILTAPPDEAHKIARHLADYVLVWAGGGGDDLAKSPHMARIGNSVYPGLCPNDPTCMHFGFYSRTPLKPTKSMENSLLYKLSLAGIQKDVQLDENLFSLAFQSKFGKVRIFKINNISQKSKDWIANPENRLCDKPGSWYCPGQYPPALKDFIASRRDFKQLEDFNVEKDEHSQKYNEEYMRNMEGSRPHPDNGSQSNKQASQEATTLNMIGCYFAESDLPASKEYIGGMTGAAVKQAVGFARENHYKYFAVARVQNDGHSFFFNEKPTAMPKPHTSKGCNRPCLDEQNIFCGCAGDSCGKLKPAAGENHVRRWMVYEL